MARVKQRAPTERLSDQARAGQAATLPEPGLGSRQTAYGPQ